MTTFGFDQFGYLRDLGFTTHFSPMGQDVSVTDMHSVAMDTEQVNGKRPSQKWSRIGVSHLLNLTSLIKSNDENWSKMVKQ